jgi:hypothetical protein
MLEFQLRGAIESCHEGGDQGAVARCQTIGSGAIKGLFGQRNLHRIKSLVQVHHEAMKTVRFITTGMRHRGNSFGIEQIIGPVGQRLQQSVNPGRETIRPRRENRRRHQPHIVRDARNDARSAGNAAGISNHPRPLNDGVEIRIVDSAGDSLPLKSRSLLFGVFGMSQRELQQGENIFDAVIRCQRSGAELAKELDQEVARAFIANLDANVSARESRKLLRAAPERL